MALLGVATVRKCCGHWANDWSVLSRNAARKIRTAWVDANCGADGRAMTPSRTDGVLNDALPIYFLDASWSFGRRTTFASHEGPSGGLDCAAC